MTYSFRRMTADDLKTVGSWLQTPEVKRWWGDPDGEISLLKGDLDDPAMRMWIVSHEEGPFAYIQDYDPHSWPAHPFGFLPLRSRGIDQFIGEPDMLGRGYGSALIGEHVARLFAEGAPASAPIRTRRTPAPSALMQRRALSLVRSRTRSGGQRSS